MSLMLRCFFDWQPTDKKTEVTETKAATVSLTLHGRKTTNQRFRAQIKAPSTRIRMFFNPPLFLSGCENIHVHMLCDHSVFMSNSPVHTYSDSLRIDKIVTAGTGSSRSNTESSRTALLSYLSCFCQPFCPVDNVKSLQMSSRLLA